MTRNKRGDHTLNRGPLRGNGLSGGKGSRAERRHNAKYGSKTDLGRDELFRHRLGAIPKSHRIHLGEFSEEKER